MAANFAPVKLSQGSETPQLCHSNTASDRDSLATASHGARCGPGPLQRADSGQVVRVLLGRALRPAEGRRWAQGCLAAVPRVLGAVQPLLGRRPPEKEKAQAGGERRPLRASSSRAVPSLATAAARGDGVGSSPRQLQHLGRRACAAACGCGCGCGCGCMHVFQGPWPVDCAQSHCMYAPSL